jgi:hypothetical protein
MSASVMMGEVVIKLVYGVAVLKFDGVVDSAALRRLSNR